MRIRQLVTVGPRRGAGEAARGAAVPGRPHPAPLVAAGPARDLAAGHERHARTPDHVRHPLV